MTQRPSNPHYNWNLLLMVFCCAGMVIALAQKLPAQNAKANKPNILVIMGDDIGWYGGP